ncbi:hypothetical protein sphantq_02934 [Sphingobium sp. AntQ-1]|uniref:NUMOD4 motif-containing HNH endonuclease n=1 Tax=Sphingobium sp. AntQ-1 TaxID=2930091 RepID=UPI00234EB235|nr:NUMOD4 motif-containing HNH endonuclease [Sphingobium sp. AntQ-1]WCP14488.1 hypothetical protein sphantq_02934 [Sphingobium sp. AntQ-1]
MAEQSVTIIYVCEKCQSRRSKAPDRAPPLNLDGEVWLPVKGFEGFYEASSAGRIRSVDRVVAQKDRKPRRYSAKILSLKARDYGYYQVSLCRENTATRSYVHRIVCETFHGPAKHARMEVAHGDGNRLNNAAANLRWVTSEQNSKDMQRHGTWNRGDRSRMAKLDDEKVRYIRSATSESSASLGRKFGVSAPTIREIRLGRKWKHVM